MPEPGRTPSPCDHREAVVSEVESGHVVCPCGAVGNIVTRVEWPARSGRVSCPSWHFLPGPYCDDPERKNCPNKDTHAAQRREYDLTAPARTQS